MLGPIPATNVSLESTVRIHKDQLKIDIVKNSCDIIRLNPFESV
jgi:hypothetical protein